MERPTPHPRPPPRVATSVDQASAAVHRGELTVAPPAAELPTMTLAAVPAELLAPRRLSLSSNHRTPPPLPASATAAALRRNSFVGGRCSCDHAEPVTGAAGAAHRLSPSPRATARRLSLVSVTSSETMSPRSPRATSPRPRMLPQQHRRSSIVPVDELDGAGSETPAGRWQSPRRHKVSPSFSEV